MPTVGFSPNILSQVDLNADCQVEGSTVREALDHIFEASPKLRTYLLNDDGSPRKHVAVVVNGTPVRDRAALSDPIGERDEIFVMQALSGG